MKLANRNGKEISGVGVVAINVSESCCALAVTKLVGYDCLANEFDGGRPQNVAGDNRCISSTQQTPTKTKPLLQQEGVPRAICVVVIAETADVAALLMTTS